MFDHLAEGRWWDRAWTMVEGCTPCSPGCERCWALGYERRFLAGPLAPRFRGDRIEQPRRRRVPTAYAIWNDLMHPAVEDLQALAVLQTAAALPRHVFLVLTKRPERLARLATAMGDWPANVWAGTTVCNQAEADEKVPLLLQVPAAVRFLSIEPMLGAVNLEFAMCTCPWPEDAVRTRHSLACPADSRRPEDPRRWPIHWVIAGGETGAGARPAHPDWIRSLRDQCRAAGVPFYFKQWGEWMPFAECGGPGCLGNIRTEKSGAHTARVDETWPVAGSSVGSRLPVTEEWEGGHRMVRVGRVRAGRELDGRTWDECPEWED